MIESKYICPICKSKCLMCDDEYQCIECEHLEREEQCQDLKTIKN
jgi:hypothetical protein